MKIIHTSDWHLGQNLIRHSREKEHKEFLSWLLKTLQEKEIELLLISGDIFDTVTPPNSALTLYYDFLSETKKIESLKKVVVVAGNHDSIYNLSAPKQLLENLNIKVVASGENLDDEILHIPDFGIVCAVPYLRDGVLKKFKSGETSSERSTQIQNGLQKHYEELYKKAREISEDLPVIATGHLTTLRGEIGDGERNIYIGNLDGVPSEIFKDFDYVALGHLHKCQKVSEKIYYSGSPIPLTFKEAKNKQFVMFYNSGEIEKIEVPRFREIVSISTNLQNLDAELSKLEPESFVEVFILDEFGEYARNQISDISKNHDLHILSERFDYKKVEDENVEKEEKIVNLNTVKHEDIFLELFEKSERKDSLLQKYREIVEEIEI
ncbi:exonuclease SbcD [Thiovulum sp. ES]|nr:exonuclease SbcD [Thiovulum sp. ES]